MGFVLPTKALEDLFRQICMNKNQIMKTYKRKKVLEVIDVVLVVNLQVVEEVKGINRGQIYHQVTSQNANILESSSSPQLSMCHWLDHI